MNKPNLPASIPCNPGNWSASSRRSYNCLTPPDAYRDRGYLCWRCKQPAVYTAEAQRLAYEVLKANIWQRRVLCGDCFRQRVSIEAGLKQCRASWQEDSAALRADAGFLQHWLSLLREHVRYGGKADEGNTRMLEQMLKRHEA